MVWFFAAQNNSLSRITQIKCVMNCAWQTYMQMLAPFSSFPEKKHYLCVHSLTLKFILMTILSMNPAMLLSLPSGMEWLWIVLVVIILFGGRKIPELARGIGKGIREFNDAKDGIKKEIETGIKENPSAKATSTAPNQHTNA
jgi:sec-independent protein translocase protein TatA